MLNSPSKLALAALPAYWPHLLVTLWAVCASKRVSIMHRIRICNMNQIQLISRKILCDRLKLQMGLDPDIDIEPRILQVMWLQLNYERIAKLTSAEAPWMGIGKNQVA